ncbi:MAG: CopG family transcriptional regulator [Acidobacteriota bacterium]
MRARGSPSYGGHHHSRHRQRDRSMSDRVTIKIPRPLYERIQSVIEGSGFSSPTDFIVYVLRDLMGSIGEEEAAELQAEELLSIRRKLQNLGYL